MDEYSDPLKDQLAVGIAKTARIFGDVCTNTVRNMIARGELEAIYIGDRPLVTTRSIYAKLNGIAPRRPGRSGRPRKVRDAADGGDK